MTHQIHLLIFGKVQGVWYRASARDKALELGLAGWVRNRPDGSVEIVAQGGTEALHALKDWCMEGPPLARVSKIDETWNPVTERYKTVEIR